MKELILNMERQSDAILAKSRDVENHAFSGR
jgi:hypothetical protein